MLKNILKVGKVLTNDKQKEVHGGCPTLGPACQYGGDPECCGYGPGQCGNTGGNLTNHGCACF